MAVTRVLLVDDESLVRRTLKQIMSAYKDLEVVGEAANGEEAMSAVERLQTRHCDYGYSHAWIGWNCRGSGDQG